MHLKQKSAIVMALPLILFVTLAMLQPPARAVNDVPSTQIIADSVTAQAGSTVDVNIRIANNAGILGAQLTVTYPSELALTRAKAGEAFSPLTMTKPGQFQSPCSFVWDGQELLDGDVKDGVILTLTFAVSESAAAGAVLPIRIAEAQNSIVDGDLNHVAVTIISGTVTIQDESASGIVSAIGAYQENLVRLNIVSSVEAKKVTDAAQVSIEQSRKESEHQLRQDVGAYALQIAEQVIRKNMKDDNAQRDLVKKLLNEVESNN